MSKLFTEEGKKWHIQRISDYEEDLTDAQKSFEESLKELEDAIKWKYKMMENLVEVHKKLQELKDVEF